MSYKIGDKFIIEIVGELKKENGNLYRVNGIESIVFDDYELDALKKVEEPEPEVDWSKVPIDTPILVKDDDEEIWKKRHFAKFCDGKVCAYSRGFTSWTGMNAPIKQWGFAKLADVHMYEPKRMKGEWGKGNE